MSAISRAVRDAVRTRLSDASTGFTPRLTAAMAAASVTAPAGFRLPIDFNPGRNFFLTDLAPDDPEKSAAITFPQLALYAVRARNENLEKFHLFAGTVEIGITAHLSWISAKLSTDFEAMTDCFEEALIGTFNDPALNAWSLPLVYNGDIQIERSKLSASGRNWKQSLACRLTFEVSVAA